MSLHLSKAQCQRLAALLAAELAAAYTEERAAGASEIDLRVDIARRRAALHEQYAAALLVSEPESETRSAS